ncbi:MAG TPA: hypothetical protein VEJ68_03245 [Candidatus Bathyarchaeia archaeon]|nr:hypothetical protein [Candidatus Bathyarchaeia archaeon]
MKNQATILISVIVIAIGTSAVLWFVFSSETSNNAKQQFPQLSNITQASNITEQITYSIPPDDPTKPIPQYYENVGIEQSCGVYMKSINGTYATCPMYNSSTSGIGYLREPIFRYLDFGASNYPPPGGFRLVNSQPDLLTPEQIEKVLYVIKNDPQIKSQPFDWKVFGMGYYPMNYSWYNDVRLVIHGIRDSDNTFCRWDATVTVNLNTLTVVQKENTDIKSYTKC